MKSNLITMEINNLHNIRKQLTIQDSTTVPTADVSYENSHVHACSIEYLHSHWSLPSLYAAKRLTNQCESLKQVIGIFFIALIFRVINQ